jgi:hypothetical protein
VSRIEWTRALRPFEALEQAEAEPDNERAADVVARAIACGQPCSTEQGGRILIAWPTGDDDGEGYIDIYDVVAVRRGSIPWPASAPAQPPADEAHRLLAMGDKFDRRLEAEDKAIHVSADGRGKWRYVMADESVLVRQRRQGKPDEWSVEPRP